MRAAFSCYEIFSSPGENCLRLLLPDQQTLTNLHKAAPRKALQYGAAQSRLLKRTRRQNALLCDQFREQRDFLGGKFRAKRTRGRIDKLTPGSGNRNLLLRSQFGYGWQHGTKNFSDRSEVIPRNPMPQFNQCRSQSRNHIQDLGDLANFCFFRRPLRQINHDSHQRFLAKRYEYARPRLNSIAKFFRYRVSKCRSQRHSQRHIAKCLVHISACSLTGGEIWKEEARPTD